MGLGSARALRAWVSSAGALRWLPLCACLGSASCWSGRLPLSTAPRIDAVEIVGADAVDTERLLEGLATRSSPGWLLGALSGEYEFLDEALLERDLERVERFYRARGFYEAKVVGARVIWTDTDRVRVQIVVSEGQPVRIAPAGAGRISVQLNGLESLQDASTIAQLIAASPRPDDIFDEADYERAKRTMRRILADQGYAFASVSGRADVDLGRHDAVLRFDLAPGPRSVFGPITIAGLEQVPEGKVRDSLLIAAGDDYSAAALEDARRALVNLGVFASVSVEADTSQPASAVVPVKVTLLEAAPRVLRLGGGARLDAIELAGSLTAGWENRNFLGGLRHLSLEARPGVVLFPTRMADFPNLATPDRVLLQGAIEARLVQPSFLEGRIKGFSSVALEVQPLLYSDTPVNAPLIGFLEVATRAGLERPFLSHQFFLTLSLNWLAELPLDYGQLTLGGNSPPATPGAIRDLYIVYPELLTRFDLRDDPLDPKNGLLLSNSLQVAVPTLGGSLTDLRLYPEARFYVTKSKLTLAFRAATGLLFPLDYFPAETVANNNGLVPTADQQVLLFRGFFSGGPFSNRGYAFQGVGGRQPFLPSNDRGVPCSTAEMDTAINDPRCLRPVGRLTSWEVSLELRFPIQFLAPLGAVLFLDSSDVRLGRAEYSLATPHLSPGVGLRYPTPIGPIRLDAGLRVLEVLGKEEPNGASPTLFGAPVSLQLAVGQAF
ncbi:MAG TPA: POTRA domain-containing protein [Polyangiaceae bacterium]|nr:POTRA domain-containing protein [Polyangiaceae bacterium]